MRSQALVGAGLVLAFLASGAAAEDNPAEKTCKKPELRDQVSVSAEQMNYLTESTQSYLDCMKTVIEAKRDQAKKTLEAAQTQAQAANAAVTEVNGFIEAFRAYQAKHKDDK